MVGGDLGVGRTGHQGHAGIEEVQKVAGLEIIYIWEGRMILSGSVEFWRCGREFGSVATETGVLEWVQSSAGGQGAIEC